MIKDEIPPEPKPINNLETCECGHSKLTHWSRHNEFRTCGHYHCYCLDFKAKDPNIPPSPKVVEAGPWNLDDIPEEPEPSFIPTDEKVLRERIGCRLRRCRLEKKISIYKLARLSGVSNRTISRIEQCDPAHEHYLPDYWHLPSLTVLLKLCNALETDVALKLMDWTVLEDIIRSTV
jgi:DNA-binding XRE family transcriptional regulator